VRKVRDVVLLHGWGSSARVWDDLAGRLAPRLRVHVPDLPGYGAAPACAPNALEAMADSRRAARRGAATWWGGRSEARLP
jgi:pimeloyl-ACP methyl ester carboxylesterase